MSENQPSLVQVIAEDVAQGRWEVLMDGSLFRSIRGVQSKIELIETPNALASLSRCVCQHPPHCPLLVAVRPEYRITLQVRWNC